MEKLNVLIASDSFKGSMTSQQVADAVEKGIRKTGLVDKVIKIAVADGGEGTVEAICRANSIEAKNFPAKDALLRDSSGQIAFLNRETAVIETASPCGLERLKGEELKPLRSSSYGLGEMILHAITSGVKNLYIGLGGSATNDGGMGLAKALGVKFSDAEGNEVSADPYGMLKLSGIDISSMDKRPANINVILLSDVKNPLCGKTGATYVYGPQKGLKANQLEEVDAAMLRYGRLLEKTVGKKLIEKEGAGAAGGIGAALMAYAGAEMRSGAEELISMLKLEEKMNLVDIVITGEGRMDFQSAFGKAPVAIAKIAKRFGLPVIAIVGSTGENIENVYTHGIDMIREAVHEPMSLEECIASARDLVENAAARAVIEAVNIMKQIKITK